MFFTLFTVRGLNLFSGEREVARGFCIGEPSTMTRLFKHIVLPVVPTVAVLGLYFTPVALLGCVTRGLMAVAIVSVALLAALATVGVGLAKRIKGQSDSVWWIVSTLILMVPALLVPGPLG